MVIRLEYLELPVNFILLSDICNIFTVNIAFFSYILCFQSIGIFKGYKAYL